MTAIIVACAIIAGLLMAGSATRSTVCYVERHLTGTIEEDEAVSRFELRSLISFERDGEHITIIGFRDCEGE